MINTYLTPLLKVSEIVYKLRVVSHNHEINIRQTYTIITIIQRIDALSKLSMYVG